MEIDHRQTSCINLQDYKIFKTIKTVQGLFEIKIKSGGNIFRVFCCFDEGELVILFNGFQKKTQKTPSNEIEKATKLMKEYFNEKNHGNK